MSLENIVDRNGSRIAYKCGEQLMMTGVSQTYAKPNLTTASKKIITFVN